MSAVGLRPRGELTIHFAHPAYRLAERFALRETGIAHFQTWTPEETLARAGEGDVLVVSGFWSAALRERAQRLRFVQVCAAGYDQFDLDRLRASGILLATGGGVNRNAVSDHAMALVLALARKLPEARDNQRRRVWRGIISELDEREDELCGKTLVIYGMGAIGERLARLAKAFEMTVLGVKRDVERHAGVADEVHPPSSFRRLLPRADFVVLTCPLTQETRGLVDASALQAMRRDACVVNVARGGCVDTLALVAALQSGRIAGAGIDVTDPEPLPEGSPLWGLDNVLITPHTAGETRRYEDNVLDILLENLGRLWAGSDELVNRRA